MEISDVLDKIKESKGITTNSQLGRILDIDKRRIGEYYAGRQPMDDDYPKIAMAANMRVDELQAIVKLKSKDEKSREIWRAYYKRIGGIAASIAFVIILLTPTPSKSTPVQEKSADTLYYVKSLMLLALALRVVFDYV
jgi:hypothetical protein